MRSKKNESIRKRKYGKKKSYKSKKCGCGMKIPFLKWGGDSPNGQVPTNKSDLSSKISGLFTNLKNATDATTSKLTGDFNEVTTKSKNAFDSLKNSTENVIGDTNKDIENTTTNVFNKVKNDTSNATDKTTGFFTSMFEKAKDSLHSITKPTTTTNQGDGNITSKSIPQSKTTSSSTSSLSKSTNTNSSTTKSTSSNSSNSNQKNYINNSLTKLRAKLSNKSMKGGKRKSLKKTKRRRRIYKHRGGNSCMDGPVGIEKSSLAFTASPISNINAVGPRPDQMYGQTPYPAWRFSN